LFQEVSDDLPCVSQYCRLVRCNEAQLPSQSCGGVRAIADLPFNGGAVVVLDYPSEAQNLIRIGYGLYNRGRGYSIFHLFFMVVSWVFSGVVDS
jgi:hypothetical protein